jgi:glyoxylase-like metal-dependent hydrolase (beta-lactamase superfamily II)
VSRAERDIGSSAAVAPMPPGTGELAPGVVTVLSSRVRRVIAPNPSLMTGPGTGTYLVGEREVAVIDPGPDDAAHLDRVAEVGEGRITWVLYTHTHQDHSPGVAGLVARTGARTAGFAPRPDTEDPVPDIAATEGWRLELDGTTLRALHTPGHASNHLCWLLEEEAMLFSGDHIMNGSTVVIAPPDGDMAAYLDQLERLKALGIRSIAPGHGRLITDPLAKIDEYLTHRRAREDQVLAALNGPITVEALVAAIYTDIPAALVPVARYSVWAHLRKLESEHRATSADADDIDAAWSR